MPFVCCHNITSRVSACIDSFCSGTSRTEGAIVCAAIQTRLSRAASGRGARPDSELRAAWRPRKIVRLTTLL